MTRLIWKEHHYCVTLSYVLETKRTLKADLKKNEDNHLTTFNNNLMREKERRGKMLTGGKKIGAESIRMAIKGPTPNLKNADGADFYLRGEWKRNYYLTNHSPLLVWRGKVIPLCGANHQLASMSSCYRGISTWGLLLPPTHLPIEVLTKVVSTGISFSVVAISPS